MEVQKYGGIADTLNNKNINIDFCTNNGEICLKSDTNGPYCAGGMVGEASKTTESIVISNCENNAKISDYGNMRRNYRSFKASWL